jgi:hypothetical protein
VCLPKPELGKEEKEMVKTECLPKQELGKEEKKHLTID